MYCSINESKESTIVSLQLGGTGKKISGGVASYCHQTRFNNVNKCILQQLNGEREFVQFKILRCMKLPASTLLKGLLRHGKLEDEVKLNSMGLDLWRCLSNS